MTNTLANLARMTTSTTGTGTITLGSALSNFLTFEEAGLSDGAVVTYAIESDAGREIGQGTYTASGTTLSRDVVYASTNLGTKLSLTGTSEVFITPAAEDFTSAVLSVAGRTGDVTLTSNDLTDVSAFARTLLDDVNASAARATLGVDAAGTNNSTDVTLVTASHDYLSLSGQAITLGPVDLAADITGSLPVGNINATGTANSTTYLRGDGAWATITAGGGGDVNKVGTPVNNQIGVWTGDGTLEGDANLTWSGDRLIVNGAVRLGAFWSASNTDIDAVVPGFSTTGALIEGPSSSHIVVALRENDVNDRFSIISGGGNYTSDTTYDTLCLDVSAVGDVAVGNNLKVSGLSAGVLLSDADGNITAGTVFVADRTALKALDTSSITSVYLTEAGREGPFVFSSGDYSSQVTADTQEGVYIAATDTASSSGAWVRVVPPTGVTPAMFGGAKGNSTTSSITAIEAAYAHANYVHFDGLYYVGDGGVDLTAAGTVYADAPGCGVAAIDSLTETTGNGLINITASGVNVLGLLIDGRDDFRRGVRDTAGGARVEACKITNIYSTTASTAGIFANATAGGSVYRGNTITEIESVGNAPTTGDDNGASRGIQIFTTAAITAPYVIHDNDISRIIGEEGDGVQILCFSSPTFYSSGKSVISENRIERCSKRAVKVQAHETTVRDNNIVMLTDLGADLFAGIDIIDSEDAIVDSNRVHVTSTVRGISVTGTGTETSKRPVVSNNRVKTDTSTSERAIFVNEFEDCSVINNYVEYGYINITNGTKGIVANNTGNDLIASGTIGFIQTNTDANQITFDGNTVLSGAIYAAVHVQASNNFITHNRRMDGDARCVYLSTATATSNIIRGNLSSATTLAAVIYSTVAEVDQTHVGDNYNSA